MRRGLDVVEAILAVTVALVVGFGLGRIWLTPTVRVAAQLGQAGAEERAALEKSFNGRRFTRDAEEWAIRDFFSDRREGIFLDVGASYPREENNTYYLESALGWHGIAVDAIPDFAQDYAKYRPRTKFVAAFISDVSGQDVPFYVPTQGDLAASDNREHAEKYGGDGPLKQRQVHTMTLNDLLQREGVDHLDFVSIDIELAEPRALAGFDIERYKPRLICIEAHPQVRQSILDYFYVHHYVVVGKYLRLDTQNLYFTPAQPES